MPRRDAMPRPINVQWRCVVHAACTRKVAHPTEELARTALGRDRRLQVYRCPFCRLWHLGRPPNMKTVRKIAAAIRGRAQDVG